MTIFYMTAARQCEKRFRKAYISDYQGLSLIISTNRRKEKE